MFQNRFSRHLSEAQILEETGVSWSVKLVLAGTIFLALSLLWAAAYVTVNEAVKTTGEFTTLLGVQHVQPPEGGIVVEIAVKNGDIVNKGDLLVRLTNTVTDSEQRQMEARLMVLKARAIRQEAFLQGVEPDFSPIPAKYADVLQEQRALLETQNQVRQKSLWVFDNQIAQKQSEIELAGQNLRNMEKTVQVNADLMQLQENLGRKNLVSRLSQLESQRVHLESEGKAKTLRNQIAQSRSAMDEVRERKNLYERELRNQANQELGTINNELSQVRTLLDRMSDRTRNLEVFSPIRGRVQDSRVQTLGAVFNSRDILMEIVPEADDLQLELQIATKDVGYVHPGQEVAIQVTSFDYNRFGGITGRLVSVSPFTQMDAEKNIFYKGIVKPNATHVGDPAQGRAVLPGMKARADIISGNRSILSYILNPLTRPEQKTPTLDDLRGIWLSLQDLISHFATR